VKYPHCLSEAETIEAALAGRNLARYGDGEFSLMTGGNCVSQIRDPNLARELQEVLSTSCERTLPCLPTPFGGTPKQPNWLKFTDKKFMRYFDMARTYGSAFVSRPDSAPWIDTTEYWQRAAELWRHRDVTLVLGSLRSLRPEVLRLEAASVREVWGPRRDAYAEMDRIIEEIGTPSGPVILCLGPTATVMADRLARKNVWAIDLGHLGMFLRHAGGYRFKLDDLASPEYRSTLEQMHAAEYGWGNTGGDWAKEVQEFAAELDATVLLDYGCGRCGLFKSVNRKGLRVTNFDVGMPEYRGMPKPVDITVSTDVLEHIEPDKLDNVIDHIFSMSAMGVFLNISLRKAKRDLPDGRNAHLIIAGEQWWLEKLKRPGWKLHRTPIVQPGSKLTLWYCREGKLIPCLGISHQERAARVSA